MVIILLTIILTTAIIIIIVIQAGELALDGTHGIGIFILDGGIIITMVIIGITGILIITMDTTAMVIITIIIMRDITMDIMEFLTTGVHEDQLAIRQELLEIHI